MKYLIAAAMIAAFATAADAQSFSCRSGRPACLDYGDTICSSRGKCVDSNAVCFDEYQCGLGGFTCKSNVEECVDDYNDLLNKHNILVNDYNDILGKNRELIDDYNTLLGNAKRLETKLEEVEEDYSDLKSCISNASTLPAAQDCSY